MKKNIDSKKFTKEIIDLCVENNPNLETKANNLIYDLQVLVEENKLNKIKEIISLFNEDHGKICSSCHISLLSLICYNLELKDYSKKYFDKVFYSLQSLHGELGARKMLIGIEI